jgi:hypothetical protein
MIIYKIKVFGDAILPFENQPPVAVNRHTPKTYHVTLESMKPPTREVFELFQVIRRMQRSEHAAQSRYKLSRKASSCAIFEKPAEGFVFDIADHAFV